MIPTINVLLTPIEEVTYPTQTYKIEHIGDLEEGTDRINGYTDDLTALMQAIYLILGTERYRHIIYSWDYGVELLDLFGKPMPYVMSEVERRISEALLQDDRILEVKNFEFEISHNRLHTTFEVTTIYGTVQVEKEVFEQQNDYDAVGTRVVLYNDGTLTYNVPSFLSDNTLLVNDLPRLDENGVLIYE